MDKKVYIDAGSKEPETTFFESLIDQRMIFDVHLSKRLREWEVDGSVKVIASRDGNIYGTVEAGVKSFDNDVNGALSTVMMALANYISSDEFSIELEKNVKSAEEGAVSG